LDGDAITIAGATPSGFNGTDVNVNVTSTTTFTYLVSSALSSPATGTITATPVIESSFNFVSSCNYNNKQVIQEASGGNVFQITEDTGQDNGVLINFKTRGRKMDGETQANKFMSYLDVIGDKLSSSAYILIRYTDDDYLTYSYYRRADLSLERTRINRLGAFKRRAIETRYTGSADLRLEALEMDVDGGTV
jgi:hypothetical protein